MGTCLSNKRLHIVCELSLTAKVLKHLPNENWYSLWSLYYKWSLLNKWHSIVKHFHYFFLAFSIIFYSVWYGLDLSFTCSTRLLGTVLNSLLIMINVHFYLGVTRVRLFKRNSMDDISTFSNSHSASWLIPMSRVFTLFYVYFLWTYLMKSSASAWCQPYNLCWKAY